MDEPLGAFLKQLCQQAGEGAQLSDCVLLERFVSQHDTGAFTELLRRHGALVLGVCRRLLSGGDVEDAFQATFLVLVRKAPSLRREGPLAGWLHRVAHRVALRARAQIARRRAHEQQGADMTQIPDTLGAAGDELLALLDSELERLPERYRLPLVLCGLQGATHAEAASLLGWPLGTLAGRLSRARALLRSRLLRRGVSLAALPAGLLAGEVVAGPLPPALLSYTSALAGAFSVGAPGAVSGAVLGLTRGALRSMLLSRLKFVLGVAALLVLMVGGGWALQRPGPNVTEDKPAAKEEKADAPRGWKKRRTHLAGKLRGVRHVRLSPDGKWVAAVHDDLSVRLWDVVAGKQVSVILKGHPDPVTELCFSRDGKTLAGLSGTRMLAWEVPGGKVRPMPRRSFREHEEPLQTLSGLTFTADGRFVVAATTSWMIVADLQKGGARSRTSFMDAIIHASAVAYAPNGKHIVVAGIVPDSVRGRGDGPAITLFDTGRERGTQQGFDHERGFHSVVYSPGGETIVAGGGDGVLHFYDRGLNRSLRKVPGHTGRVGALAFNAKGTVLASGGEDKTVRLWEHPTGKPIATFKALPAPIRDLRFVGDGRKLMAVDAQGTVCVWATDKK
jgi:RNA polymerase sigma factor (sigma-70 family)